MRPHLEAEQLEFCRAAALQELQAIEDEPGQKLFIELKRRTLPEPLGRPILGNREDVERIGVETLVDLHRRAYRPNSAIIGVAGAVQFEAVRDAVERILGDWAPMEQPPLELFAAESSNGHIYSDKAQTHIGIGFPSVSFGDRDFFNAHGAVGVLSGGMSARLFTELREKRGLCYSVSASYYPLKELGYIFCHCGTTTERASESLELLMDELRRLPEGIAEEEVRRVQAGLKSSLIMQQESTSARASSLARSWHCLGRVRGFDEIAREVDRLSAAGIIEYLERHPPADFTIVTLGSSPLEVPL
jgi:predicted Zn-dependent peptidase